MTRILIVDDQPENLYLLRALLTGHGCAVDEARDGAEALVKARQSPPQLIISDLLMPVMDGYTLLRHWKLDARLKLIPFIVYTATSTEPQDEKLALDLGADAFILQPAEPEAFMARVRDVLGQREAGQLTRAPSHLPPQRALSADDLQQVLVASELRYRRLFETTKDGILILDAETGMIVDVNPFLIGMLGYSHEAFLGKKVWELGFFKNLISNEANFVELQAKEYLRYEDMPLETSDGRRIEVEFVSNVYRVSGQKVIQCQIRDISERKRVELALRQSYLELEQKNAELERFLYAASHDLKSPVVTVRTFLGYLEQDLASGDAARIAKDFQFIRTAADKMAKLLDDLLEMSRVGRVVGLPVNVTFQALVKDALGAVAGRIAERGVTLQVQAGDASVRGDHTRLAEVFQNLIDNACKFMGDQKDPRIEIGFEARGAETVFLVRDNGIGIDPRFQSKVFNLFEKLEPKTEGSGLGLAIVRRIVELHGGRIWVESAGVGHGACFYFTLPRAAHPLNPNNAGEKL